jgi:predicted DNA-binding protein (MmcQ/YjbR family)
MATLFSVKTFTKFGLGLKATVFAAQWGSHVAKVGGKVFALISDDGRSICFKVTELSFDGLTDIEGIGQAPYFAKRHWVAVDKDAALEDADLKAYIARSHAMVAETLTRKLRTELGLSEP